MERYLNKNTKHKHRTENTTRYRRERYLYKTENVSEQNDEVT